MEMQDEFERDVVEEFNDSLSFVVRDCQYCVSAGHCTYFNSLTAHLVQRRAIGRARLVCFELHPDQARYV